MKTIKTKILYALCMLFLTVNLFAQESRTVSGTVVDSFGDPMPGVSIAIKNTQTGTITGLDGDFTINVSGSDDVLVFSFIGFTAQEIKVGNNTTINVKLQEDSQALDEVVVVGYGVQKKVNLTGSVSNVSGEKLESRPVTNLSSALAGLAAGVTVSQSSGEPGSDNGNIRVRGVSTFTSDYRGPLVIIDGSVGDMNSINPNDVESIVTLKDAASAAIYGSRGANGVILVTTKRGKQDTPPRVTYTGIFASQSPQSRFKFMSNYADYMDAFNIARSNMGQSQKYGDDTIDAWREASKNPNATSEWGIPNWVAYPNTDWQKEMFQSSFMQTHNLSVTGGSKNTKYLLSKLTQVWLPSMMENLAHLRLMKKRKI
ncbi:SusC/RagA family TonB-linked outer membrane protein [Bacteroides sp. 519]|uniref:SusC/RagA family TonB-linked outer membrane protein n=1 Tax=Bacteroides sp. 519 TaxID=2302937 RepID=UPI0013D1E63C|nr:SusC/RagA family TonB-linked outer membrane protein [Bacteroides sp. 519]NDV60496.1 SusC/RagA family TonB-linked outer membrane protein [Bacteroides sp. 519]